MLFTLNLIVLDEIKRVLVLFAINKAVGFVLIFVFNFCFGVVSHRLAYEYKWRYFKALMLQDKTWYDSIDLNQLPSEFYYNVSELESATGKNLALFIYSLSTFLSSFIVVFVWGFIIGMIFFTITIFAVPGGIFQSYIDERTEASEKEIFNLSGSDSQQALSSIKVVKAFGQENKEIARFQRHLEADNREAKNFN